MLLERLPTYAVDQTFVFVRKKKAIKIILSYSILTIKLKYYTSQAGAFPGCMYKGFLSSLTW